MRGSGAEPAWVRLRVADAGAVRDFYGGVLGLEVSEEGREMRLAPPEASAPVLVVEIDPGAPRPPAGAVGLFHLALKVPDRAALARVLRRLGEADARLQGASDHRVSEALYLADPEGNGVEIYRDRPRDTWRWRNGEVGMDTLPLDVQGLLAEDARASGVPPGTTLGHVHLRTADLAAAEAFWTTEVGLEVTAASWPGARFLASGGYHHHLGLNTWGPPPTPRPPGARGLVATAWRVPGRTEAVELVDPDGAGVVLLPG